MSSEKSPQSSGKAKKVATGSSRSNSERQLSSTKRFTSATKLFFRQLYALLWKCFISRRVHWLGTTFEAIGVLVVPMAILEMTMSVTSTKGTLTGLVQPIIYRNIIYMNLFLPSDFIDLSEKKLLKLEAIFTVVYTPSTDLTDRLVASLNKSGVHLIAVRNEAILRDVMAQAVNQVPHHHAPFIPLIGLSFAPDLSLASSNLSFSLFKPSGTRFCFNYKAGQKYSFKFHNGMSANNMASYFRLVQVISYISRAYLYLQCSAENKLPRNCTQPPLIEQIYFYLMPYPSFLFLGHMSFMVSVFDIIGCIVTVCYVLVGPIIVKRITEEKAGQVKEMLRLMGISNLVFWLSHFINYQLLIIFQAFGFVVLFFYHEPILFRSSSPLLFFIFFLLFGIQLILFSMVVSTLFNKPVVAVIVTSIIWCLSAMVNHQFLVPSLCKCRIDGINNALRRLTAFFPTSSLQWFFSIVGDLEHRNSGLQWSTLDLPYSLFGDFTVLSLFKIVILSCFLYAFLIFYLDNVWPFQPGVPKSPFFLFLPSYWCSKRTSYSDKVHKDKSAYYEPQPKNATPRIQLRNICKSFSGKTAVDHLCLDIYEGSLLVLLGHNGAGKTTTMNMITGMFNADSGTIHVNGFDVATQTNEARRSIGLCPQENIYFNELTVGQHLRLFALLKNYPMPLINKEVNYVLQLLHLSDKCDKLAKDLSGGMKRKLQLGIAMIADTETLILDEVTSGMDPEARRVIWDLLIAIRRKRTILLTTHYMEEADVLADRIAIMNKGSVICSGSPIFLKTNFGDGYRLRVAKLPDFQSNKFCREVLLPYLEQSTLVSEVETEVIYSLAADKEHLLATIPKLFDKIEANKAKYRIESVGLSFSTLEDVFLKIGSDDSGDFCEKDLLLCSNEDLLQGFALLKSQVRGLLFKRIVGSRRYPVLMILQFAVPLVIFSFGLVISNLMHREGPINTLDLNVKSIYGPNTETFFTSIDENSKFKAEYMALHASHYDAEVGVIKGTQNISVPEWLLKRAQRSHIEYLHRYIYGVQMNDHGVMRIWANIEAIHSLPLGVIALFESALRLVMPSGLKNLTSINVRAVPVVSKAKETIHPSDLTNDWVGLCIAYIPLALLFLGSSFVLFPVKENRSKSLQLMTGLSPILFWAINLLYDLTVYCVSMGLLVGAYLFFQNDLYGTGAMLFLFIFAYGLATIPLFYLLALFFRNPGNGFIFVTILYFGFGFMGSVVASAFHMRYLLFIDRVVVSSVVDLVSVVDQVVLGLLPLFRLVPLFSMAFGYQKMYMLRGLTQFCSKTEGSVEAYCKQKFSNQMGEMPLYGCCPSTCQDRCFLDVGSFNVSRLGSALELFSLFASAIVYSSAVVLWELYKLPMQHFVQWLFSRPSNSTPQSSDLVSVDSDVFREQDRVEREVSDGVRTDLLTVHKLRKTFGSFCAVNGLSFGVRRNECFGFLGVNGAGKTTCFSLLTGDLVPTSGDAFIGSTSLLKNMNQFRSQMGYCPQFDALLEDLTADENLYLFARLRGIPQRYLKRDVDNIVEMIGLTPHRSRPSETYSGGNKRKLSIAIALLGSPRLLLLDEPSAGVDPAARRQMWRTLGYIRRHLGCSVMLTSHSMEECEALCSRIGIMVSGTLRCLGSTQHLRHRFGQGYSVTICLQRQYQTDRNYAAKVAKQLVRDIPSAKLKDHHQCSMQFSITDSGQTWSSIFAAMNRLNDQFAFEDYTVADTSLEQIFISFARGNQTEASDKKT